MDCELSTALTGVLIVAVAVSSLAVLAVAVFVACDVISESRWWNRWRNRRVT